MSEAQAQFFHQVVFVDSVKQKVRDVFPLVKEKIQEIEETWFANDYAKLRAVTQTAATNGCASVGLPVVWV